MIIYVFVCVFLILLYIFFNKQKQEDFSISKQESVYDNIDIIYYINLNYRTDRNRSFLQEMEKIDFPKDKIKRFSAIKHNRGEIGCSRSHIEILKEFIDSNYENCIIFEDDFVFNVTPEIIKSTFQKLFDSKIDYDIIMLAGNTINNKLTQYDFIRKVNNGQTTSGYLLSKKFAKTLLNNYIESEKLLSSHDRSYYQYFAIDQYWKILQPNNKWYIFNPVLGKQKDSYSDIEKVFINY
jgi:glycosyl transferase family 25